MSILVLASASCVTCAGEFLQRRSLINELAATRFSLFRNATTGPPLSFAVITRSIYCTYFQHSKLISLCRKSGSKCSSSVLILGTLLQSMWRIRFPPTVCFKVYPWLHTCILWLQHFITFIIYFNCLFSYNIISCLPLIEARITSRITIATTH